MILGGYTGIEGVTPMQKLSVTTPMTVAAWNTIATHEVFTVTGDVHVILLPLITTSLVGAGLTATLGVEGALTALVDTTLLATLLAGTAWLAQTPLTNYALSSLIDRIIVGGLDIGYQIAVAAATAGSLTFHCWWEPLTVGSTVVAGAGGPL
jgi:hypothetical protein